VVPEAPSGHGCTSRGAFMDSYIKVGKITGVVPMEGTFEGQFAAEHIGQSTWRVSKPNFSQIANS
jgi:hypothetical protein